MYLDYYKLKDYPFSQALNTNFYYDLQSHHEALNILLVSLGMKDGIIKITGETGSGKSLLCKLLLEKLGNEYFPIYLPNPYLSYEELMQTISDELKLKNVDFNHNTKLTRAIKERLIEIRKSGKHVILLFDEAQGLSKENLESIRILSNMEDQNKKLVQIVLVGGLELDEKLDDYDLRHFTQRITFSYKLDPMRKDDVKGYVLHRLSKAAEEHNHITITSGASKILHKSSGGSPRVINVLCHKALLLAFSKGEYEINANVVAKAVDDTSCVQVNRKWKRIIYWASGIGAIAVIAAITLYFTWWS